MTHPTDLPLPATIIARLHRAGHLAPTPIQSAAIPYLLEGRDLLGIAQTGTGKTAAYSLPLVEKIEADWKKLPPGHIRSLILVPTRELAKQIQQSIGRYLSNDLVRVEVAIGGQRRDLQVEALQDGIDILIGTPGRILDLAVHGDLSFELLQSYILDEADMMLDMGFLPDVENITNRLPESKQIALFSATMPSAIEKLAQNILENPMKVEVTPQASTIDEIEQKVYFVDESNKLYLLVLLLEMHRANKVIVFCKAKYAVSMIVEHLKKHGITVCEIHSNLGQLAREESLRLFSAGEVQVLVATDIASRGIDIPAVTHVINFNIPEDAASYVHRIGRTARAGHQGSSFSLCMEKELPLLRNIETLIKKKIPVVSDQPFHLPLQVPAKMSERRFHSKKRSRR